ncbi:sulfite exporter TauE/SafE family protein [Puia sp. P3]|uniref:sulfite exporter TauE/SafE family protein n=1 Tax=Puia sp. P3 TaxID=3423952 RepID=UPI003D672677
MEIAGYFASALIGISLGLIGGGGSILTMPVLVYLFNVSPALATSYSLFVVGSSSLVGAWNNYKNGLVRIRTALLFGIASIATVFLTRKFIMPAIPEEIAHIRSHTITKELLIMVLFAALMLSSAVSMIRAVLGSKTNAAADKSTPLLKLLMNGLGIGLVTGLLGAGGGFLLIPSLVLLVRLPMKEAIGTSLLIIALNSLIGFTGDLGHQRIDWGLLLTISLMSIAGIFVGGHLSKRIRGEKLKAGFGWFVLAMGIYIMAREILFA